MDVKYQKRKMSRLSEEEKAKYIKALRDNHTLEVLRGAALQSYREQESGHWDKMFWELFTQGRLSKTVTDQ